MAVFQVLNGSGIGGAGVQFGSLGQIGSAATDIEVNEGFGSFSFVGDGELFFTGFNMLYDEQTNMFFGNVLSLNYSTLGGPTVFSITGVGVPLADLALVFLANQSELTILGDMFSGDDTIGGSTENDRLLGFDGADLISSGDGDDVLIGGAGADIIEGGTGVDTARYAESAAPVNVNLSTGVASGGDAAGDSLTGIENLFGTLFSDTLTGDDGDNFLNDGGFSGADSLTGGLGDDTYAVYNAAALIVETAGQGTDRVAAGVDFVLDAGLSIERLNTTSLRATYDVDLTGNELKQLVRGNDGANVLDGGGGNDQLFGEGGADVFRFSSTLVAGNVARIGDFSVVDDQIELDSAVFVGFSVGALDASAFKDNATSPKDADDRIYYNSNTGSLFFDVDGVGGASPIKFASLTPGLALSAADFTVI